MNALELADKLEQKALTADAMEYGFEVDFEEAATMLRQQQAEIEALKSRELTDEEILEAQKPFSNMHKNATESWGSLDLNNQSNLECARAWFIEGFAHGQKLKELTDEKITAIAKEIFKDYKNFHHYQIDFARAVIKEVSGK